MVRDHDSRDSPGERLAPFWEILLHQGSYPDARESVVRWGAERDIEELFGHSYCRQAPDRCFVRAAWESIWDALWFSGLADGTISVLDDYFRNKSCGYGAKGQLQKAFAKLGELHGGSHPGTEARSAGSQGDFLWFHNKDAWRRVWGGPRTMHEVVFRILRGSNDARADLHHRPASECDLDYHVARNIVEAFLASGWRPPGDILPTLQYDPRPLDRRGR